MLGGTISAEDNNKPSGAKITGNNQGGNKDTQPEAHFDFEGAMAESTKNGGLTALPPSYGGAKGFWRQCINSENLFTIIYLDYKHYRFVTPPIVEKNYKVFDDYWRGRKKVIDTGTDGERDAIIMAFGSEKVVTDALASLKRANDKLKTEAGILDYYNTLDRKRYESGISAIQENIEIVLERGELTTKEGARILLKGTGNQLTEDEVIKYIERSILAKDFKARAVKPQNDFFENKWMTDEAWKASQQRTTKWLDNEVSSLEEVGKVTFQNKEKATNRIAVAGLLSTVVTQLTNDAEAGYEFQQIVEKETDPEKRFLKVVYRLNPALPFRVNNESFKNIREVFERTAYDYDLFLSAANSYKKGHIHIWLMETDPKNAPKLTQNTDYNSFLTFVYRVRPHHPSYINKEKFETPEQLIKKAQVEGAYWIRISEAMQNGVLPVWFEGLGKKGWLDQYNSKLQNFIDADFYTDDDKKLASVQTLIQIIDSSATDPEISAAPQRIQLLALEGSKLISENITLALQNHGFAKAEISLDNPVEGISINTDSATFYSLAGNKTATFKLEINPLKLIKDKLYAFNIVAHTSYQAIAIPVEIKVIFPKKAFISQLVKYGAFGAAFFGFIRWLVASLSAESGGNYSLTYYHLGGYYGYASPIFFLYFVILLLLVGGLVGGWSLIKKAEKI